MKSKYPLYFGLMAIVIAIAALISPNEPLSSSIPIVLGEHATLFAYTFFVIGFCLVYSYYKGSE